MSFTTLDIRENQGKTNLEHLIPAIDANFSASNAGSPSIVTITGTDGTDGTASIALQIQDVNGNAIASRSVLRVWISGTTFTAPSATGITGFAVATGVELDEETNLADYRVLTNATGSAVLTLTAANGTYYCMAESNGLAYSGAVVITGN